MQVQERVINGFHLSPQQKRLWGLQQDNPTYRVQCAIRLEGLLQIETLKAALVQVCDRHEILRTTFQRPAGIKTPLQVIAETSTFDWQQVDLQGYDAEQQTQQIETLFQQEQLIPFNWQHSLLRGSLLVLSQQQHILLLSLPALCADSWSIPRLVEAVCQSYKACLQGTELQDEVVQYVQFAEWRNQLLEEDTEEQTYWQKHKFSSLTALRLPFEKKSRTNSPNFVIDSLEWQIQPEIVAKISALAKSTDTTPSSFLLACWQILLSRFVGQPDLTIGVAMNGRKYEELETTIGLLAQYLPLSCSLENLSFKELLQQTHASIQEVEQWQEYFTWDNWAESAQLGQLSFGFDFQQQTTRFSAGEVSFKLDKQFAYTDCFKLKLSCIQREEMLIATADYDVNLFDAEDIHRLIEHFQILAASAIAAPETSIDRLEILSDCAHHQLLVEFNQTQTNFPKDQCIHQLFEAQVERTPDQVALVFEDQQLTYAELNARANQLAHYLQTLGIQPDELVGIYLDRSLDTIISLLGILKAGAAYLPLDPALPLEALASRVEDARPIALLTQERLLESVQSGLGSTLQIICLDQDQNKIAQHSTSNLPNTATPENLIYVIYTSGSTGQPKGVAVEHRNLLNYLYGILGRLSLSAGAHFATVSTLAADLGNTAIFPALCTGGCLHVVSSDRISDPQALADYCHRHPIDCLKIVPSHLQALLISPQTAAILPRQCLVLGGEAASWELIKTIQKYAPNCQILNHYGPTEATVGVLTYAVPQGQDEPETSIVPLGRAIANTQIYLLDSHQQPVPIGVKGELYIGGDSLTRGYLDRPDLTQEKFISNPFNPQPGARLYKTGDFARYLPDGTVDFLGRTDNQVKIRGYRIELEEIEAVLQQCVEIKQVVVTQYQDATSNKRLVAYIVSQPGCSPSTTELRHFMQQKLPEYMVPSAFVFLKSLPLTQNGKVDRQALPAPQQEQSSSATTFVAPRTPIEAVLADIWADLLKVSRIGIHDSFFELGGHSLLMTQLLVRVRETFQVDLPLSRLFVTPTVAGLAKQIEYSRLGENGDAIVPKVDLVAEATLDPAIRPTTPFTWATTKPTRIFLTGATGFLGAFLLCELLEQTSADIYCLIRSTNLESAQKKLRKNLETYLLWQESFASRIIPVVGELAQPLLGLSKLQFQELASQIDVIYHNGALVNFTYPYAALKLTNVSGTQEVLRLASQVKVKPVHFISTTNAVSPKQGMGVRVMYESDFLDPDEVIETGYAQSKWVAEQLVLAARDRGLPICIYRPGRIAWDSRTGIGSTGDNTFRMIKGCIQLGSVPQRDVSVNLIPADFASKAIVQLSQQEKALGKTFHLVNPNPASWSEVIGWVRSLGYPLQEIPDEQWREQLREVAGQDPNHALHPLVPFLAQSEQESSEQTSNADVSLQFDCQNTLDSLVLASLSCPSVDADLVHPYFSYLITQGLLEAPTESCNSLT
ncbi:MAG: amino acid adenylation domain-containing protein [Myxacorys californica WJT36-NPBG1]|jgi:amino acid adenylation domain-containing protein/thioester reductase-like protein|nr:amino acid adenylation domain-containing protein [Myxacorys californica WJT36-NPBG1]